MAIIKTLKFPTVINGTFKADYYKIELNGEVEAKIETSGKYVLDCSFTNRINEGQGLAHPNFSDAGVTEENGSLFLSGFASTDDVLDLEIIYK